MTEEKWEQIIGNIKDTFKGVSHETLEGELKGEIIDEVVFENDAGTMKLVRHTKPRVLEEKTHYSGRIGSSTGIEKVYSDIDMVNTVKLYREDNGDWQEIDVSALGD
jgi:hypothetical protein